ncbi:MAG: dihydroorotase family protein [Candidatus Peregrinibacteria bacterium]
MSRILLRNGEIVTTAGVSKADVLVENGKIVDVGDVDGKGAEAVDCSGKVILPGLIDAHVHFREPGQEYKEDFESGSMAAASGGVTTVFDMPNNKPPILSLEAFEKKRKLVLGRSYVNYAFYMGCDGKNFDEVNKVKGECGVKVYGSDVDNLEEVFDGVDKGKLLVFHAEDKKCLEENEKAYLVEFEGREVDPAVHSKIHSVECALKAVERICKLAKEKGRAVHLCHVSTEAEFEEISKCRDVGVTGETAPQYLTLSSDDYGHLGNLIKMNPAVRDRMEVFGVWKCLKSGLVDMVATDHAPHLKQEKESKYLEAPSGVPGVEFLLPMFLNTVNNDGMTLQEVVLYCCERPAQVFGLKNKGRIEKGYDADLVVVDMEKEKEILDKNVVSKCGWSPYSGSVFKGWPVMTYVNGGLVYKNGKFVGGKYGKEVEFS